MSKIGKKPIMIPQGVTLAIDETAMRVKGPKGELVVPVLPGVKPVHEGDTLRFEIVSRAKQQRSNWGTVRALAQNAVIGATKGFEKTLMIEGVGFRIAKDGNGLALNLGFSHPVKYPEVPGIEFEVEKNTVLKVKGNDKMLVGKVAAEIRALKKPEPYKGKGFRYANETIRRKAGKKSGTTSS